MSATRDDALSTLAKGLRKFEGFSSGQLLSAEWPGLRGLAKQDLDFFKQHQEHPYQEVAIYCMRRVRGCKIKIGE